MFFLVFVLFTSRWSVRKVLDCFFNMHLCAKLQPYSSKKFMIIRGQLHDNSCKTKGLKHREHGNFKSQIFTIMLSVFIAPSVLY